MVGRCNRQATGPSLHICTKTVGADMEQFINISDGNKPLCRCRGSARSRMFERDACCIKDPMKQWWGRAGAPPKFKEPLWRAPNAEAI